MLNTQANCRACFASSAPRRIRAPAHSTGRPANSRRYLAPSIKTLLLAETSAPKSRRPTHPHTLSRTLASAKMEGGARAARELRAKVGDARHWRSAGTSRALRMRPLLGALWSAR